MAGTNYAKVSPSSAGYNKSVGGDEFYLLFEDGSDLLLLEDGSSFLILESSDISTIDYTKGSLIGSDYEKALLGFLLIQNGDFLLTEDTFRLILEGKRPTGTNYS